MKKGRASRLCRDALPETAEKAPVFRKSPESAMYIIFPLQAANFAGFLENEEDYPRVVFFFALADRNLLQKSLEDGLLGLLRGEPQGLQLQQLSPAILPMAASWISCASGQLAVIAGMDSMWAWPMMIESHWTWPKHWLLPTITGWNTCLESS